MEDYKQSRRAYLKNQGLILGGIFFSSQLVQSMASCRVEETNNLLLTEAQMHILDELTEIIIPRTDTPGAQDVKTAHRIEKILLDNYEEPEHLDIIHGLDKTNEIAQHLYESHFSVLDPNQKEQVVNELITMANAHNDPFTKPFFPFIKGLTMIAYFTAPEIMKSVLLPDSIPEGFKGDVPYSEINGIWAISNEDL